MVNLVEAPKPLVYFLLRRAGLRQHTVDVDGAGTVISFWMPEGKVPKDRGTVRDVAPEGAAAADSGKQQKAAAKPAGNGKERPAVVLVHGFAAEGVVTWQFQVCTHAHVTSRHVLACGAR
jgi:hypothetical protein